MLRNPRIGHHGLSVRTLLNEVLSLNAQESMTRKSISVLRALLNEVLSLNAQELGCLTRVVAFALLNEVLSLNAQEFTSTVRSSVAIQSSMKS